MKNLLLSAIVITPLLLTVMPKAAVKETSHNDLEFPDSLIPKKDSVIRTVNPQLVVEDLHGKQTPLRLSKVNVSVEVRGNRAVTNLEMEFLNETDRILEGQLIFPLGEGQHISRFALEVNGTMREGVVVEKEKGQEVYEKVIRQNVDPGLLELTQGNNYKARVYPIPAKGRKKLAIAYEQELIFGAQQWLYLLPLGFPEALDQFDLSVKVLQQEIQPKNAENELANLKFEKWESNYVAEMHRKNFLANKQIGFTVPVPNDKPQVITGTTNGEHYFYTVVNPHPATRIKKLPGKIALLWDVSGSSIGRDIDKEIAILDQYFKTIGNAAVQLVVFSNTVHPSIKMYPVTGGEWSELKAKLKSEPFDGATQLGELDLNNYEADEFILCSDGLSSFGKDQLIVGKAPVVTIASSQSADFNVLKRIAAESGGQFLNLNQLSANDAIAKLKSEEFHFIRADYDATRITETYPSLAVSCDNTFGFSGMYSGTATKIVLHFGYGQNITERIIVELGAGSGKEDPSLKKIWAWKKMEELELINPEDETTLAAFAKENSLVTRFTSLIVLDRMEDYVTHKILPPAEFQKEYWAAIESEKKAERDTYKEHLEMVVSLYENRINWWNTDFSMNHTKKEDKKQVETTLIQGAGANSTDSISFSNNVSNATTYNWSYGDGQGLATGSAVPSVSGHYTVTVTDANGAVSGEQERILNPEALEELKNKEREEKRLTTTKIELSNWNPDVPYLKTLKAVPKNQAYAKYLEIKKEYSNSPSFYLDVSDYMNQIGYKDTALRILSNIAEMDLQNHQMMRVLAHRLEQLNYYELSIDMYRKVAKIRSEEPQSYRDLGLALAANGQDQEAIDVLYTVVEKSWDQRFPEIEVIVMAEINAIVAKSKNQLNLAKIDKRLQKALPCDVRVVVTWDTDNCDMDLWVTDPRGETCKYDHPDTQVGGKISRDFTGGYGPEEFIIRKAMKGTYKVQVNYYGTREQTLLGPTTIQIKMITGYGTPFQKTNEITRRLSEKSEVLDIGALLF